MRCRCRQKICGFYAEGFEASGVDLAAADGQGIFRRFLCENGPAFYGLPVSNKTFTLMRQEQPVERLEIAGEGSVTPLPLGVGRSTVGWRIEL